jgi:hypothetical protein
VALALGIAQAMTILHQQVVTIKNIMVRSSSTLCPQTTLTGGASSLPSSPSMPSDNHVLSDAVYADDVEWYLMDATVKP